MPLVISAIINVAQDVDEPWPLEVYGHDGKAYNITMEPGDMIFYESHSVIHGRPFPLKGRYYAVSILLSLMFVYIFIFDIQLKQLLTQHSNISEYLRPL